MFFSNLSCLLYHFHFPHFSSRSRLDTVHKLSRFARLNWTEMLYELFSGGRKLFVCSHFSKAFKLPFLSFNLPFIYMRTTAACTEVDEEKRRDFRAFAHFILRNDDNVRELIAKPWNFNRTFYHLFSSACEPFWPIGENMHCCCHIFGEVKNQFLFFIRATQTLLTKGWHLQRSHR